MAIYSGFPSSGAKDWDDASSTNPQIRMYSTTNDLGGLVGDARGYAVLDTAAVVGKTITAATLTFWNYTSTWFTPSVFSIYLWDGSGYNVHAYSRPLAVGAHRYITTALTLTSQMACINASGGSETSIRFSVSQPDTVGVTTTSEWLVNAYESGATVCTRIGIRYNEPAPSVNNRRRIIVIG